MLQKIFGKNIIIMCKKGVKHVNTYICNIEINKCAKLFLVVGGINIVIGFRCDTDFVIITIESEGPEIRVFFVKKHYCCIRAPVTGLRSPYKRLSSYAVYSVPLCQICNLDKL